MAVDPLVPIDSVTHLQGIDRTTPTQPSSTAGEICAAMEIANNCPDVRADLVADVRARLQNPSYLSATVIDRIAERIQDPFGT